MESINIIGLRIKMFNKKYFLSQYSHLILHDKRFHNRFWILYLHKLKPEGSLLDAGCGEGFFLRYAEKYYKAVGVDISEYAINRARKLCKKALLYIQDVTKLDLGTLKFDIVTCFDVLEHLSQPDLF
jgi:2-polyprenyl-3-methyl-5-hydroxy-6-metoxy-1,4-benzoquinol methylase